MISKRGTKSLLRSPDLNGAGIRGGGRKTKGKPARLKGNVSYEVGGGIGFLGSTGGGATEPQNLWDQKTGIHVMRGIAGEKD